MGVWHVCEVTYSGGLKQFRPKSKMYERAMCRSPKSSDVIHITHLVIFGVRTEKLAPRMVFVSFT